MARRPAKTDIGIAGTGIGDAGTSEPDAVMSGMDSGPESGAIDPATIGTDAGSSDGNSPGNGSGNSSSGGRKRGRPAKSATGDRPRKAPSSSGVKGSSKASEAMLASVHQMIALYLRTPGIALSPDEAKALGEAIANVQEFYPNSVFDPKYTAWAALVGVALRIELPRVMMATNAIRTGTHKRQNNPPEKASENA